MKQILFIDQFARLGGGQRILLDVVDFLAKSYDVRVALPEEGPVTDLLRARQVDVFRYRVPSLAIGAKSVAQQFQYLLHARKTAGDLVMLGAGADLLYVNGPRAVLPAVMAARQLGKPVLAAIHLIHSGKELKLLRWCFQKSVVRRVVFCSDVAASPFDGIGEKGQVIWNWVSAEFLDRPRPVPHPTGAVRAGVLGRVSKNKGQRLFLEAALPLAEQDQHLRLSIGGDTDFEDPAEMASIREYAAASSAGDQVSFEGSISDPVGYLDSLDIVVVPSIADESFGLVAAEAMARGKPVIATQSGGLNSLVIPNVTGLLVPKDAVALAHAVKTLVHDPDLRQAMGERGRESVVARFSPSSQLTLIRKSVDEILHVG